MDILIWACGFLAGIVITVTCYKRFFKIGDLIITGNEEKETWKFAVDMPLDKVKNHRWLFVKVRKE